MAPPAKEPAVHQHPGAEPCTAAAAARVLRAAGEIAIALVRWLATYAAAALVAIVLSSAVPMEPPSCWPTLSVADATPASLGATPKVPVFIDGGIERPMPAPATISGPSTAEA